MASQTSVTFVIQKLTGESDGDVLHPLATSQGVGARVAYWSLPLGTQVMCWSFPLGTQVAV